MKKNTLKRYGFHFLILFLLLFMILIFGPAEIFFANVTEFEFVYGEFAGYLAVAAVAGAFVGAVILIFLPPWLDKLLLSGTFGIALAGYLQVMFFNKNLELLGLNPEGYQVDKRQALINLLLWIAVIAAVIFFAFYKEKIWKMVLAGMSAFLIAIQTVALISLLLSAPDEAYHHQVNAWYLSGEDQFVVSEDKNVIVFVLDWVSNQHIEPTLEQYPDLLDPLKDFTYYNNTNVHYFGTFPSILSTFSGTPVDPSIPVNEWCRQAWESEKAKSFYGMMREKNYTCNIYTPDRHHICGTNDVSILKDTFSNLANISQDIDVFYKLLFKTITKMSCYRMMPEMLKTVFYTDASEYTKIIGYSENVLLHENYDFYDRLQQKGLTTDSESNYFIIQHLAGGHEHTTTAECTYAQNTTLEETVKGNMLLVGEYLNQMKELGVYDDATIIVTSDHGGSFADPQVIFFIKEAGVQQEEMKITNAPIELGELLPTIAEAVGADYTEYGKSIHDFQEDELRERSHWIRVLTEDYPNVPNYAEDRIGTSNVYYDFTYTGNYKDLLEQLELQNYKVHQMADCFY